MRSSVLISLSIFIFLSVNLNSQHLQWLTKTSYSSSNFVQYLVTDKSQNVYACGTYNNGTRGNVYGLFVCKYDPNGNVLWSDTTNAYLTPKGMAADVSGNSYVVCTLMGKAQLGQFYINSSSSPFTSEDIVLIKYNTSGQVIWVKLIKQNIVTGMKMDQNGFLYLTGPNYGSIDFGNNQVIQDKGVYLSKFDQNGDCLWAKQLADSTAFTSGEFVGPSIDHGYSTKIIVAFGTSNYHHFNQYDLSGNYLSGYATFYGQFCSDRSDNLYLTQGSDILKLDASRNPLFNIANSNSSGMHFCTDSLGDFYTSEIVYPHTDSVGTLISKYDKNNGSVLWKYYAKGIGLQVYSDGTGNVYAHGGMLCECTISEKIAVLKLGSSPVGISENTFKPEIKLFPNPANDQLYLQLNENTRAIERIDIFSSSGAIVKSFSHNFEVLNIQDLTIGPYLMQVRTASSLSTHKFMKN